MDIKDIRNGVTYENCYARAAAYFLGTCAPAPDGGAKLAVYNVITGIYKAIADNAQAVGYRPLPDVTFAPWESQKGREQDVKTIRTAFDRVEAVAAELFNLTEGSEILDDGLLLPEGVKPGKYLVNALTLSGVIVTKDKSVKICLAADCAAALSELARISRKHTIHITDSPKDDKTYLYFSRCVFEPDSDWNITAFDSILGADGALTYLCHGLEARGFTRIDCREGKKISVDYVKNHSKKQEPLKASWAERTHSGIEVSFEELRLEPCFVWIRMPAFKSVLEHIDQLPEATAKFIADYTKTCDGCRYCVNTDKTGTRPLASLNVNRKKKCPYYPGFSMNWRTLDRPLADMILSVLDAIEAPGILGKL